MKTVIETQDGWMIKCRACQWHEFPKQGRPGSSWTFNGDLVKPTFSPSMNESRNDPNNEHYNSEVKSSRCHFILSNGIIKYCSDCSHDLRDQSFELEPWDETKIKYYEALKLNEGW